LSNSLAEGDRKEDGRSVREAEDEGTGSEIPKAKASGKNREKYTTFRKRTLAERWDPQNRTGGGNSTPPTVSLQNTARGMSTLFGLCWSDS